MKISKRSRLSLQVSQNLLRARMIQLQYSLLNFKTQNTVGRTPIYIRGALNSVRSVLTGKWYFSPSYLVVENIDFKMQMLLQDYLTDIIWILEL